MFSPMFACPQVEEQGQVGIALVQTFLSTEGGYPGLSYPFLVCTQVQVMLCGGGGGTTNLNKLSATSASPLLVQVRRQRVPWSRSSCLVIPLSRSFLLG